MYPASPNSVKNVKIYKHLAVATNLENSISYKQPYSGFTSMYTIENSRNLEIHLVKSLHLLDILGIANIWERGKTNSLPQHFQIQVTHSRCVLLSQLKTKQVTCIPYKRFLGHTQL